MLANTSILTHTSVCIWPIQGKKTTLFNTPALWAQSSRAHALWQRSETVSQTARAYTKMSFFALIAFQLLNCLKSLVFKSQCLKIRDVRVHIFSTGLLVQYTCTGQIQNCFNHFMSVELHWKLPVLYIYFNILLIRNKVSSFKLCPFFRKFK